MAIPSTTIRNPNRGFALWHRHEIYDAKGSGQYIPNKADLVFDPNQGFFVVTYVDVTTGLSTLNPWTAPQPPETDKLTDQLLGVGPGTVSESFRIFLDQSVTPHTLVVDTRLFFFNSDIRSYQVFRGTTVTEADGEVISAFYDPSGNFLGTEIPVKNVIIPESYLSLATKGNATPEQATGKMPVTGFTLANLMDGEQVTIVAYLEDGTPAYIAPLFVANTQAIRQSDSATRYVKSIALESPFLSPADPDVIEFPINVPVRSLPMTAVVHYSDGSRVRHAVDGTQFSLLGLDTYLATVPNQRFPMVLSYRLASDEISYSLSPTAVGRLTHGYTAKSIAANGAYEVKLFVFPTWVSPEVGYRLEYWLYNLDRQTYYNVTPYIELGTMSQAFDPIRYGVTQTLTVALDLNKVDGRFAPYRHVQTFKISLLTRGNENRDNWQVALQGDSNWSYGQSPDGTRFKAAVEFVNVNYYNLDISCGFESQNAWLDNVYRKLRPLYDAQTESGAPTPTHFRLEFLHNQYEFTIDQWRNKLVVINDLEEGELMYIRWIRRTAVQDLQLGMSALPVHQQN